MLSPQPKVLVSGCFDLLHSGHVQFFREAAEHGDLYVRLGTDANIFGLKKHKTFYKDEERLFMVQNLECVHDAKLSTGTGVYDFEADMDKIKPDIYFVNEDASQMEGRVKICADRNIKMVVAPRKPHETKDSALAVRSSTDMKARLRQIVAEEEKKDLTDIAYFNDKIPWRFCFAGGWMDLKWCNEWYHGCVVTLNIQFKEGVCKDQCGLATSSRKTLIKMWNGKAPKHLEAEEAAQQLYGAENFSFLGSEKKTYLAGSQDHCGLFFPGINKLCYEGAHWPSSFITLNDPSDPKQYEIFKWLEAHLYVVDIPLIARPGNYNSQRINHMKDPNVSPEEKRSFAQALGRASEAAWDGIVQMDSDKLGLALSDTMKAWEAMLPYTVDPYLGDDKEKSKVLREFWGQYDRPHTKGCLFSGAGGGFLMVISDKPVENGMQIKLNHSFYTKPFPSDKLGDEPRPARYSF